MTRENTLTRSSMTAAVELEQPTLLGRLSLSGIGSREVRVAVVFVWLTGLGATISMWNGYTQPWLIALALALVLGGLVMGSRPGPDPMPGDLAWAVSATVAATTVIVLSQVAVSAVDQQTWFIQVCSYLCGFVVVRGHPGAALAGAGAMLATIVAWAIIGDASVIVTIGVILRPVLATITGFAWAFILRRNVLRISAHRRAEARAAVAENAAQLAIADQRAELSEIREKVAPLLARIATAEQFTADDRLLFQLTEASVRDRVRAPGLAVEPLASACEAARRRGVDVLLLDDSGPNGAAVTPTDLEWLAGRLMSVDNGHVVMRLFPPGRGPSGAIVIESLDFHERVEFGRSPAVRQH